MKYYVSIGAPLCVSTLKYVRIKEPIQTTDSVLIQYIECFRHINILDINIL